MGTKALTQKSGHLAWCALVALLLARRDGVIQCESQENIFLTRWLATALKQRRFPREMTPDIEWLLKQGRTLGVRAKLRHKLDYLWRSCAGELHSQSDLFRLTYAMETAREMHWIYRLLGDKEWSGRHAVSINPGINGIYVSRSSLNAAFDDDGNQTKPLMSRVTGATPALQKILDACGWQCEPGAGEDMPFLVRLMAVKTPDAQELQD